ncbi:MAG: family 43 glycosylhydrolase [Phycisphaerales bacterium]|nr:MAG: family 43 glycosylhydrolase [Phycisphaerales bacterium]
MPPMKIFNTTTTAGICLLGILLARVPCHGAAAHSQPQMLSLAGDLRVHDPAMIRQGDRFYIFSTGGRPGRGVIYISCSPDLHNWTRCGYVFDRLPDWSRREIPAARSAWAPDISFFNGKYHLYYSVSTFGRNDSAIGLATNLTLDPNSPDYKWRDRGIVVRSVAGRDNHNAIDGNLVLEDPDKAWLCWGSFWSGIKMRRIDRTTGKPSTEDAALYSLAARPPEASDREPGTPRAVEAPFIVRHGAFWYLFVSFDLCCRGADSTYKIMVGRSKNVTGPYTDRRGRLMTEGGGSLVLEATTPNWRGPGHCAIVQDVTGDYMVFHAYHGKTGRPELKISTIVWEQGWPRVAALP